MSSASACKFAKIIQHFRKWFSFCPRHAKTPAPSRIVRKQVFAIARLYYFQIRMRHNAPRTLHFGYTNETPRSSAIFLPFTSLCRVLSPNPSAEDQKDCPLRADSLSSIRRQFPISNGTPPSESSHTSAHSPETRSSSGAARAARDSAPSTRSTQVLFCSCQVWLTAVRIA